MSTIRLQLHLSAKELKNLGGLMGTSDPFAVVTVRGDNPNNRPAVVGQTDVVFNNLNPSWSRVIYLDGYKFGAPLYFEVGVFDFDATQTGKTEQELSRMDAFSQAIITSNAASRALMRDGKFPHKVMGTALFEVGEVLASKGSAGSKSLQTGGAVYVSLEKCSKDGDHGKIHLQLRGIKLKNCQSLGRSSSPFFELYRKVDQPTGATWISVYRSNAIRGDLDPLWSGATLDLESTCNGDLDRAMKVIVWDHRRSGKHKMMGELETSMRGFVSAALEQQGVSDNNGFTLRKMDKHVGLVQVLEASLSESANRLQQQKTQPQQMIGKTSTTAKSEEAPLPLPSPQTQRKKQINSKRTDRPEFVDYMVGGCQISLAVAIDFTASNGDPRQPGTPHYFHPPESKEWNDYEKAIFAVGSILAKYDSDQQFPVWGFGAKYNNVVRHCFQCGTEVEVEGVQGIMDAYRGVFRTPLTMSYPTKLNEVVQTAAAYARHEQETAEEEGKLSYTLLLILTAGNVENVKETKQQLIEASDDPLSIVIVGIGDADFSGMEFLDEHDTEQESGRDITKFVRFSDYKSFNALTEAVLDEIPDQLVEYFYSRGVMPGVADEFNQDDVHIQPADDDSRTYTFLG